MARKHLPLMVGELEVEVTGKGFRIITREDDEREVWWYAAKRAAKHGYQPKTMRPLRRSEFAWRRGGDV